MSGVCLKITRDGQLSVCSAGSPQVLVLSPRRDHVVRLAEGGQALGMFPDQRVERETEYYILQPGDTLILFTDGIIERKNKIKEQYGLDRLISFLRQNKDDPLKKLLNELIDNSRDFSNDVPIEDDVTMLGFRYLG